MTGSPRSDGIQALRALACLFVLFQHATFFAAFARDVDYHPFLAINFGRAGVSLFFVISGFVMAGCMNEGKTFLLRRLARIYPPFWISIALSFAIASVAATRWHIDWPSVLLVPVTAVNNTYGIPYWTLCYEVAFYVVVYALVLAGARRDRVLIACMIWILAIVLADAYHAFGYVDDNVAFAGIAQPGKWILLTPYPLFFIAGFVAAMLKTEVLKRISPTSLLIGAVALYAFSSSLKLGSSVPMFVVQACAFACIVLAVCEKKIHRLIGWCGDISYGTYLMHLPIIIAIAQAFHARSGQYRLSIIWITLALAGSIGGMLFGYAEYQFHGRVIKPLFRRSGQVQREKARV